MMARRVTGLPLIITRPAPGATTSAARAIERGIDARAVPLFAARAIDWTCPDAADFDALLLTSAQAPRLAGDQMAALADLPCYAVGAATAAATRAAGLEPVQTGTGGGQALIDAMHLAGCRRILWLCGRDHMPLTAGGAVLTPLPCYMVSAIPAPPAWNALIAQPAVIAIYSVRAACHIAAEVMAERKHLKLAVISQNVATAAGTGWDAVAVADTPTEAALLSKARLLCHKAQNEGRAE